MKWFNSLKVGTRIVCVTLAIVVGVVTVNYIVFVRGYQASAEHAMSEEAKAFTAVADEAKNHASLLHKVGAFDTKVLTEELTREMAAGHSVSQTRFFKTIPVVAGWTAAQEAARREKIEFRISSFEPATRSTSPSRDPSRRRCCAT
jgi:hypothetical protein